MLEDYSAFCLGDNLRLQECSVPEAGLPQLLTDLL